jgi:hypothetical protein
MSDVFLRFEIKNDSPVDLNILSKSLNALGSQYELFLNKKSKYSYKKDDRKLLIKEVKSGSIIIDLVGTISPLIREFNQICEFGTYLSASFDFFLGKRKGPICEYTQKDCSDIRNIVEITARDGVNSTSNINIYGDNNIIHQSVYSISNIDANALQSIIKRYEDESFEKEEECIFQKEIMYWENANFNRKKTSSESGKVIIEGIDKRPKKVIFISEADKAKCVVRNEKYPNVEWQDLLFYVDVKVMKVQDVIREYLVLKVYDDVSTLED